jgi:hypothetical protein
MIESDGDCFLARIKYSIASGDIPIVNVRIKTFREPGVPMNPVVVSAGDVVYAGAKTGKEVGVLVPDVRVIYNEQS